MAHAMNSFVNFIRTLSKNRLLHRVGINIHAERAHDDGVGQCAERLFFDLNLGLLVDLHGCVDRVGSHAPQLSSTCELRSVDGEFDALFGVGWVEHGDGKNLTVFTEGSAYVEWIGVAAGVDRWPVAASRKRRLRLR